MGAYPKECSLDIPVSRVGAYARGRLSEALRYIQSNHWGKSSQCSLHLSLNYHPLSCTIIPFKH